jgi:glucose-1-phosphate adenylyltransferase
VPVFNLYNQDWPVYTSRRALPPAKVSRGREGEPSFVDGSLLCQGSIVSGAHVERSIVGPGTFGASSTRTSSSRRGRASASSRPWIGSTSR